MKTSETISKIAPSFLAAQKAIGKAKKNRTAHGLKFDYDYTTITQAFDTCIPALHDNDISVLQPSRIEDGNNIIETILLHSCGEWLSSELSIKSEKQTPQGEGSALTYCRRYSLTAMVGLCPEDDDGAGAMPEDNKGMQPPKSKSDNAKPPCPSCGTSDAVIKGREDWGGGWLCFEKKGGCGAKWDQQKKGQGTTGQGVSSQVQPVQIKAIQTLLSKKYGGAPDNVRHAESAKMIGLEEIKTFKDLSFVQASELIKKLQPGSSE